MLHNCVILETSMVMIYVHDVSDSIYFCVFLGFRVVCTSEKLDSCTFSHHLFRILCAKPTKRSITSPLLQIFLEKIWHTVILRGTKEKNLQNRVLKKHSLELLSVTNTEAHMQIQYTPKSKTTEKYHPGLPADCFVPCSSFLELLAWRYIRQPSISINTSGCYALTDKVIKLIKVLLQYTEIWHSGQQFSTKHLKTQMTETARL